MKSGRHTATIIAVVGVLLNIAASRVLSDADVGPLPKAVIIAILSAECVVLAVMFGGASVLAVIAAPGVVVGALVFLEVGVLARVVIGLVALTALTLRLTRKRSARATVSGSRVLPLSLHAAFDAVSAIPADSAGARIMYVRELSDGRRAWTVVHDSRGGTWAEDNILTEVDRPSRVVIDTRIRSDVDGTGVDVGSAHTIMTFTAVRSGTRLRIVQTVRLDSGGPGCTLKMKATSGWRQRRHLRQIEALATAEPSTAGERVAEPVVGPYLQSDD